MKMLVLLTRRCKCSFIINSSNQSRLNFLLKQPEYLAYIDMKSGNIALRRYSDQSRCMNFNVYVGCCE